MAQASASAASGEGASGQGEQPPDHFLHLHLRGLAVADDGELHLQRRVFGHGQPRLYGGRDRGAAGLAEQQRRVRIHVDENLLHRDLVRCVARDDFGQIVENHAQALRQRPVPGAYATARDADEAAAGNVDDPKARNPQSGVDAEDAARDGLGSGHRYSAMTAVV